MILESILVIWLKILIVLSNSYSIGFFGSAVNIDLDMSSGIWPESQILLSYVAILSVAKSPSGFNSRDVLNGIIKNSLKMPGSRGRIGPGGVAPWEKLNFHTSTA